MRLVVWFSSILLALAIAMSSLGNVQTVLSTPPEVLLSGMVVRTGITRGEMLSLVLFSALFFFWYGVLVVIAVQVISGKMRARASKQSRTQALQPRIRGEHGGHDNGTKS